MWKKGQRVTRNGLKGTITSITNKFYVKVRFDHQSKDERPMTMDAGTLLKPERGRKG